MDNGAGCSPLISDLINVCVSHGRLNCVAMVRCSSEYLWSCGTLEEAIVKVNLFLYEVFGCDMYLQVSEVHSVRRSGGMGCRAGGLPARVCVALAQAGWS